MSTSRRTSVAVVVALVAGCNLAPEYARPTAIPPGGSTPAAWRELTPADFASTDGWKMAQPQDDLIRGNWWEKFGDPLLNELEQQVDVSNQSLALAAANYRVARALVAEARAQLFPIVTTSPSVTRSSSGATTSTSVARSSSSATTQFQLPFDASWEADLWGRIRNSVNASTDEAQATAADLENTRLLIHAEVAVDYFELRAQDSQKEILDGTVVAFRKALDLTKIRHEGGIASDEDVAQAETQLETTIAQDTDLGILRAQLEHAIAALVGKPASSFSIPMAPLRPNPPAIPLGLPSQLLERRPDIAAAERRVAEANAQIGVVKAAFFPTLTLSGSGGFASTALGSLLSAPSRFWQFGASLAQTLFDGGKRQATVEQAMASYDGTVATYRQTVLTAFQEVEDELASLRILSQERGQQDAAVASAQTALARAEDRYKFGVDSYLNVITTQSTLLSNQRTAMNIRMQQMTASVLLIKALGGGWEASRLASLNQADEAFRSRLRQ
jgi:NodT family efflux transporter outer membrane factor (OMF) lipoprotein